MIQVQSIIIIKKLSFRLDVQLGSCWFKLIKSNCVLLMCDQKLTNSQFSPTHTTNKKVRMRVIGWWRRWTKNECGQNNVSLFTDNVEKVSISSAINKIATEEENITETMDVTSVSKSRFQQLQRALDHAVKELKWGDSNPVGPPTLQEVRQTSRPGSSRRLIGALATDFTVKHRWGDAACALSDADGKGRVGGQWGIHTILPWCAV